MTTNRPRTFASFWTASMFAACAAQSGEQALEEPAPASPPAMQVDTAPSQVAADSSSVTSPSPAAAANSAMPPATSPPMASAAVSGQPTAPPADSAAPSEVPAKPVITLVLESSDLKQPSDLEFNPYVADELWVMNFGDSSALIVSAASSSERRALHRLDVEGARHFMPSPTAFAFGQRETTIVDAQMKPVEGTFATCPGVNQSFMGPTLWTSDVRIFGLSKSQREAPFNGPDTGLEGPGSHIDMLHSTPACTGIAWEGTGSIYWSYSGANNMFVRYDFGKDHGIGNADHSDGSVWRYAVSGIRYVPNIPAHLHYATDSKLLYMADPGNSRVVVFDPQSAMGATKMTGLDNLDGLRVAEDRPGGMLQDVIPKSAGLKLPTGIALRNNALYVSDYETSKVHKFSLNGQPLAEVSIAAAAQGGLTGLAFGPDEKLYVADMKGNRIFRIDSGL